MAKFFWRLNQRSFSSSVLKIISEAETLLIRVIRRLTLEEVQSRIKSYEKECGMMFDEFEELFWRRQLDRRLIGVYSEWANLVHAYRGYVEAGELDYSVEETRDLRPKETALLTPKRLELLYSLASTRPQSINDLAQKAKRDVKNVYHDLKALKTLGFVTFRKHGERNIIPETLIEEIILLIR